jgi:hypothetical protein
MLESGTAGPLDLFRQAARAQIPFDAQIPAYCHSLLGRWVFELAHVPKRPQFVLCKGTVVQGLELTL